MYIYLYWIERTCAVSRQFMCGFDRVVAQCLAIICSNHPPAIEQLRSQQSSMPSTAFDNRLNGLLNCWHLSEFSTDVVGSISSNTNLFCGI